MSRTKRPENMTAEEELQSLLSWADQQGFVNVAEALYRTLLKVQERPAR